mgnify:CR=1 FL=1
MKDYYPIKADQYRKAKENHEEMMKGMPKGMKIEGMEFHGIPVDDQGAFVPFEKDSEENLTHAHDCNLKRFGLEEMGA